MNKLSGRMIVSLGLLLEAAAILLGDCGALPHGLKLAAQIGACGLMLLGMRRQCRENKE